MCEDQQSEKTAEAPVSPQPGDTPQQDAASRTTKSYKELMHGFEEIRKIVDNQEKFDQSKSTGNSCAEILKDFEKIKKIIDNQENSDG